MADPETGGLIAPGPPGSTPRRSGRGLGVVTLIAAFLMFACDLGGVDGGVEPRVPVSTPGTRPGPVVGLVGTMTGPGAWRGDDAFEGADLGVHVLNRGLPEPSEAYELVTLDDRGDPDRAAALIEDLVAQETTAGVVYAGPPEALPGVEDILAEAGVPAVLCFGDLPRGPVAPPHLFQVSPPVGWQTRHLAEYILRDRGYRVTGVVTERSPIGRRAHHELQRSLIRAGGRRAEGVAYRQDAGNLWDLVNRLRRRNTEAIVVGGGPGLVERLGVVLRRMRALYRSTKDARTVSAARRGSWRPQILLFDIGLAPGVGLPAGTVAAESYGRGAHYLPLPAFRRWRASFVNWWDAAPEGRELRAFQAVRMIGWATARARPGADVAGALEGARGVRFGGMAATFSPSDHFLVEPAAVGLWTIPRPGAPVAERDRLPKAMPWVPLARTFALRAGAAAALGNARTLWDRGRAGELRLRFGVRTPRSDPVH